MSDRLVRASFASFGQKAHQSAATPDLFAYGTLTIDSVVATLLDRVPAYQTVVAHGWCAARIPGLPYPGLVADAQGGAPGRIYTDLTIAEWALLDAFEDSRYSLDAVDVGPVSKTALAYIWFDDADPTPWQVASLAGDELAAYEARCRNWRQGYELAAQ